MPADRPTRLLVIGADAAGMSAAHQALRTSRSLGRPLEVIALEAGRHTSYSACGIPYWMAGDVADGGSLVARTVQEHRAAGIDLRLRHEVTSIDLDARRCEVRDLDGARTFRLDFDELMLATGAAPVLPEWAHASPAVLPVKTLDDGAAWAQLIARRPARALVVGGGFIGVETAEAFARRGITTQLVTRGTQLMSQALEPGTARAVQHGLERLGVEVITGTEVGSIDTGPTGEVHAACLEGQEYPADVIALGLGVRPRVELAVQAGLPVGDQEAGGALLPDDRQQLAEGVWAAGDCTAVHDRLLDRPWFVPLGTHANKCGRVAGTNIGGGSARFPGMVGTSITRAGEVEVARTGLLAQQATQRLGLDVVERRLASTTASGYMPQSSAMSIWVLADRRDGRLLGCQLSGGAGAGKRIDTAAAALFAGMTVGEFAYLDLAYAPPFSPAWDPVQIACRALAESLES